MISFLGPEKLIFFLLNWLTFIFIQTCESMKELNKYNFETFSKLLILKSFWAENLKNMNLRHLELIFRTFSSRYNFHRYTFLELTTSFSV